MEKLIHLALWCCALLLSGAQTSTKVDPQNAVPGPAGGELPSTLRDRWREVESELGRPELDAAQLLALWQQKDRLERSLREWEQLEDLSLLKVRYQKGIDLIKLLYEKVLALDHHFHGMQIYQQVMFLSNPNAYPAFQKTRNLMEENLRKKQSLRLPGILLSNPYLSAAFSLIASFVGDGEIKQRQTEFDEISCILDFTVRMNAELQIIHHETEYLRSANQQLKLECEQLFADYVKVVDYLVDLETCRREDDWENLYQYLDDYVGKLQETITAPDPLLEPSRLRKIGVNLEFATQRVAEFINQYHQFINQGLQYYRKFDNILAHYENESTCHQELPYQFQELQRDIEGTIVKFESTYNLPEIQGSRMKDLLYGILDR
ncbi:MAG: hypothetical protein KDC43_12635 [Saprospiraceae bacterium]|nr:hypothetical protein [Saprospiraceae bacterium]MCB0624726.1 hypothetical protein [Saprospiraceae bacterium]MCB0677356.1 hypothetical protein [Saprospiraceae bacterium]MCB0679804.1 hypothetical protein [Saprospiraceae bacterium]